MKARTKYILSLFICICVAISLVGGFLLFHKETKADDKLAKKELQVLAEGSGDETGASTADIIEKGGSIYVGAGTNYKMTGGRISGRNSKYGGAVYVEDGGTFTLSGGEITNCEAEYGGAIYVEEGGTVVISGGKITKNRSSSAVIFIEYGAKVEIKDQGVIHDNNLVFKQTVNFYVDGELFDTKTVLDSVYTLKETDYPLKLEDCCGYFLDSECKTILQSDKISFKDENMARGDSVNIYTKTATPGEFIYTLNSETNTYNAGLNLSGTTSSVVMPQNYNGLPVVRLASSTTSSSNATLQVSAKVASIRDFALNPGISAITIPNCVTSIGPNAFSGSTGLLSIELPNTVTEIGAGAFQGCTALTGTVTIPKGVTVINDRTFYECNSLTAVYIPPSITSVGESAFYNCYILSSIDLPATITSIGSYAFYGCAGLTGEFVIPKKVTTINSNTFNGCEGLTSIVIPSGVTSIATRAFSNCTNAERIDIPSTVTSIGSYAFSSCKSITDVAIPNGVTSINAYTFSQCTNLSNVVIPNGVTSIGTYAFSNCKHLSSFAIPTTVTTMGKGVFSSSSGLTSILIPNNVTSMAANIFYNFSSLEYIYCEALSKPEDWDDDWNLKCDAEVIWGCLVETKINVYVDGEFSKAIAVSGATYTINESEMPLAYENCPGYFYDENLSQATNGVVSIANAKTEANALGETSRFVNIYTKTASDNSNFTFKSAGSQTVVVSCADDMVWGPLIIPKEYDNKQVFVDDYAFYNCRDLEGVVIPDGVTTIRRNAFQYCGSISNIIIPDCVTSIESFAFNSCYRLKSITIPKSVRVIEDAAFSYCGDLSSITVDKDNTIYDSRNDCNAIIKTSTNTLVSGCQATDFSVLSDIKTIDSYAFYGQTELSRVDLPDSVTKIDANAFAYCNNLTGVYKTSTSSLTSVGNYAFYRCYNLNTLETLSKVETFGSYALAYCYKITSLTLTDTTTSVGTGFIDNCTGLNTLSIGEGITSLSHFNFSTLTSLETVTIGFGVSRIPDNAFSEHPKIKNVTFYGTEIGILSFAGCEKLEKVIIPNVTLIDEGAFMYFAEDESDLASIKNTSFVVCSGYSGSSPLAINYLTEIGMWAFANRINLKNLSFSSGNSYKLRKIGDEAFLWSGLTSFTMPNTVTSIGVGAFAYCKELTSFSISDNVNLTLIPHNMLAQCVKLTSLVIPSNIKTINRYAFANCEKLTKIYLPDTVEKVDVEMVEKGKTDDALVVGSGIAGAAGGALAGYLAGMAALGVVGVAAGAAVLTMATVYIVLDLDATYYATPFYGCKNATIYCNLSKCDGKFEIGWRHYGPGLFSYCPTKALSDW